MRVIKFYDCFGRLPIEGVRKEDEALAFAAKHSLLTGRGVKLKRLSNDRRSKCTWDIDADGNIEKTWSEVCDS